ncbi:sensor histidine kinase [Ramlibacter sp. AN1133]|uniref:sensor histidine kinase n=1 Tax=Ramlibacter sp. AN1133 TaxID=3133429 RepID=UPI0030C4BF57
MNRLSLSQRLGAVFVLLLVASCIASGWLQLRANEQREREVVQRLSMDLASHIAQHTTLMDPAGLNAAAVRELFSKLMDVNPSVEVYLLDLDGHILADAAPPGHLRRRTVDLKPVREFIAGAALPVLGDDPRTPAARNVFSAAPLKVNGREAGYVYVVLLGEQHAALARRANGDDVLRSTLWSIGLVGVGGLLAGLVAFRWVTRPLRQLTRAVHQLQANGTVAVAGDGAPGRRATEADGDEIRTLRRAFEQMAHRIATQWGELSAQDRQRRELVANISHDLRTPLTSLHGYLETLRVKADHLSRADQERYLDIALGQSRKVNRLAEELFELARLEHGGVKPATERFSLPELLQDVVQKFELPAQARSQRLLLEIAPDLPPVAGDIGMIERVLTNLLDNAIRHTPAGGMVRVLLGREADAVRVQVADTGPGVPESLREGLFDRPPIASGRRTGGGLGLLIVRRILQLHGSDIQLVTAAGQGAVFEFRVGTWREPQPL